MDWDGNDGLRNMWDRYYRCPDPAYIQSLQATRTMPDDGLVRGAPIGTVITCNPNFQKGDDSANISHTDDIIMSPAQHRCQVDLQVVLDKHCNDSLCLLWTKSHSGQGTIPQHMLTKIRKVNMGSIVKINDQFSQAGGKVLTVMKLKELGSKAEPGRRQYFTHPDKYVDTPYSASFQGPPGN